MGKQYPLDPPTTSPRPPTPYNFNLLRSLRIEDSSATDSARGNPSAPVNAEYEPDTAPSSFHADLPPVQQDGFDKRDSAILSLGTSKEQQNTSSPPRPPTSWSIASLRRPSSSRFLRSVSNPSQRKLRKKRPVIDPEQELQDNPIPPLPNSRPASFHGISLDIPRGSIEAFYEYGRLRFSRIGMMAEIMDGADKDVQEHKTDVVEPQAATVEDAMPQQHTHDTAQATQGQVQSGLDAGPRKPAVHMLSATIHNGRILSSEEVSLSVRLRSMYERGDEHATPWDKPALTSVRSEVSDQGDTQSTSDTPPSSEAASSVGALRQRPATADAHGRTVARMSSIIKSPSEVAGGLEDYSNVSGRDVDRYGFIQPARCPSRASNSSSPAGEPEFRSSMQRVSTGLQLISEGPRQKRGLLRAPTNNRQRTSRSVPRGSAADSRSLRTMTSQHSFRSSNSSLGIRNRDQKLLNQASDMLTLPPGLEAIAEQEDAGRTAGTMKKREWKREEKWRKMAVLSPSNTSTKGGGMTFTFNPTDPLVIKRTWKGIPDRWRATAWHSFLSSSAKRRGGEPDSALIEQFHAFQDQNCADDVQIDVDVPRSINMHVMFRKRYRGGQRLLFRVLHAIALKFPAVGYVQGMASIATTLLCYYDEEMAFVMLVRLWELRGLRTFYTDGFDGLMAALAQLEGEWLAGGDVQAQLTRLGITGTAYGTRWYLTLFNMSIPFPAQLRIWDVFMLHGDGKGHNAFDGADLDTLHAASAALIDATREILLDADFETAMKTLTSWIPVKDEDLLMRVAKAEFRSKKRRMGSA